jgi:hypothetical protein
MKDFVYVGSVDSAATINGVDVILWKGKTVNLPEDNDYVKSLIAQGYLEEVVAEKKTPAPKEDK